MFGQLFPPVLDAVQLFDCPAVVMMHNRDNKVLYDWEQLISVSKSQITPELQPQNPEELKTGFLECRAVRKGESSNHRSHRSRIQRVSQMSLCLAV